MKGEGFLAFLDKDNKAYFCYAYLRIPGQGLPQGVRLVPRSV
jgi:hypothetical protein